jgi:predicted ATPase/class 3 adenylate cyclase
LLSKTLTIVFTDIVNSAALWERYGHAFEPVLTDHNHLLRERITRYGGVEVRHNGDGFFLAFAGARDAIECMVECQLALASRCWNVGGETPEDLDFRVRIGLHTGEVRRLQHPTGASDFTGSAINRAARIGSMAQGGQMLISETTRAAIGDVLNTAVTFKDLGYVRLRGIGTERLWQVCHAQLPQEFPAPAPSAELRRKLATPATSFIGRAEQIVQWHQHLKSPSIQLVTLVGPGGVGKTRVAQHLAAMSERDFADGTWWCELENITTADGMAEHIARQIGLQPQPHSPAATEIANYFETRQSLLVLDNVEQIDGASSLIHELLASAAGLKCLVTSRRALELRSEHLVHVTPLDAPEALELFVERARDWSGVFELKPENRDDVQSLCDLLHGIPLAIELAASRTRSLTPREIADRLFDRLDVLERRAADLSPRQRAMRATLDWSYDLLSPQNQQLLAQLAWFAGSFTADDARSIVQDMDVEQGIEQLVAASLLSAGVDDSTQSTRFSILRVLRVHVRTKPAVEERTERELEKRFVEYYRAFLNSRLLKIRTREEVTAMAELELQLPNLRVAFDLAQRNRSRMAPLALALGHYLQRRGFLHEAELIIQAGIGALATTKDGEELRCRLLLEQAALQMTRFDFEAAMESARTAQQLCRTREDRVGEADCENHLGLAAQGTHCIDAARRHFLAALEIYVASDLPVMQAVALHNLGMTSLLAGDATTAGAYFEKALQMREALGDERGIAETCNNLGALAQEREEWDAAAGLYCKALRIELRLGSLFNVACNLANIGEVAQLRGDVASSWKILRVAESLLAEAGSPYREFAAGLLLQAAGFATPALEQQFAALERAPVERLVDWALE